MPCDSLLVDSHVTAKDYRCSAWYVSDWIAPVPGEPLRALCRYCNVTVNAHLSELRKHRNTLKHTRNDPLTQSPAKNTAATTDGLC